MSDKMPFDFRVFFNQLQMNNNNIIWLLTNAIRLAVVKKICKIQDQTNRFIWPYVNLRRITNQCIYFRIIMEWNLKHYITSLSWPLSTSSWTWKMKQKFDLKRLKMRKLTKQQSINNKYVYFKRYFRFVLPVWPICTTVLSAVKIILHHK